MPRQAFSPWLDSPQDQLLGRTPHTGGPPVHIRDAMEARRMAWRFTPGEDHPAGYLSTNNGSRHAKLTPLQRSHGRSYQRGVHAGTRISPENYLWPAEFNMYSGLANQATTGQRFVPYGMQDQEAQIANGVQLVNDGKPGPQDSVMRMRSMDKGRAAYAPPVVSDVERRQALGRAIPPWR